MNDSIGTHEAAQLEGRAAHALTAVALGDHALGVQEGGCG